MTRNKKQFITPQMFDIRHVTKDGELDMEKIKRVDKIIALHSRVTCFKKNVSERKRPKVSEIRKPYAFSDEAERFRKFLNREKQYAFSSKSCLEIQTEDLDNVKNVMVDFGAVPADREEDIFYEYEEEENSEKFKDIFATRRSLLVFASAACLILFLIGGGSYIAKALRVKDISARSGEKALASLSSAKDEIAARDFRGASLNFSEAYDTLNVISHDVDSLGGVLIGVTKYLPVFSKLSSGSNMVEALKDLSRSGTIVSELVSRFDKIKNPLGNEESVSYLKIFEDSESNLKEVSGLLTDAEKHIEGINVSDIPEDKRADFIELKQKLPGINSALAAFISRERIFADVLGGNGPRKYLFLFQNNQEMRPTGGFIGSYAILDIFNGRVRKFFVDGIFNPDGQLRERIVPPAPIQKISANWSLHDSNWFPDFPTSAEKASWFYEKTGGPTVDGVITMTPTVLEKLLEITGPIEMPEYGVTVDKNNFIEQIQYEVEVDYDRELNQPKKILGDLAPIVLDRILSGQDFSQISKTMEILTESLNEKQILIYSKNWEIEKMLSEQGWNGEMLKTQKDYLSVINTNINGYKTDGVIDENISHATEIQNDGLIIDTVTIKRKHNGGDTRFSWWNKVSADYQRVYVPKGSALLEVSGQTREFNEPPLNYDALGYKRDPQVLMEEQSMRIDEQSGTKIYEDNDKTVFANWVYVSPGESTTVTYRYVLPFKIITNTKTKPADTYSLLVQKQSGSIGSALDTRITFPKDFQPIWKYPAENISSFNLAEDNQSGFEMQSILKTDKFIGMAFMRK